MSGTVHAKGAKTGVGDGAGSDGDNGRGTAWHAMPVEEVLERLGVPGDGRRGLSPAEVEERRKRHGWNELTPKAAQPWWMRLLLQFHQPLVYILLVAAAVSIVLGEWVEAAVILVIVLANAIIGYVQETKAAEAIEALSKTMSSEATVVRDGYKERVPARDLVPGDTVLLASGDKVPADLRLLAERDLRIAEAALTGESVPVEKDVDLVPAEAALGDRANMAFASSLVTYGSGTGVVVATGDATEVGRISELINEATDLGTPLTREIAKFSHLLLYVILGFSGFTFVVGILRGGSAEDMFHAAVALAVGAIPEGLPAAVTIVLAIGVWRMAARNAIIRKLPAVEALGSTSLICSDKTGTLTENQMTVQRVFAAGLWYRVTGGGYAPEGEVLLDGESPREGGNNGNGTGKGGGGGDDGESRRVLFESARGDGDPARDALRECLLAGVLCNDSVLENEEGRWGVQGDPTEGALLVSGGKGGLPSEEAAERYPRLDSIPFESEFQYMATLHEDGSPPEGGARRVMYVKGSVEQLLARCADVDPDPILRAAERMGAEGLRVLAFARKRMPDDAKSIGHPDLEKGLEFLGLQGMIDPPRPEAITAVASCQSAGVGVKMITGDHATTAAAIADQLGLEGTRDPKGRLEVLTGKELARMSTDELGDAAVRVGVFARVSPEQKLRLVEALQKRGKIVAMTGDGVNDAPALKQADIGVAMGLSGTDVAKDASDMILTDDNFASIQAAVEEGRGVFDNLTKFLTWTLPTNLGEGMVILAAVLLGATLPILPVQILWINTTTALFLGMTLAFEPKEKDLMLRPPRAPKESFLNPVLLRRIVVIGFALLVGAFGLFKWELVYREMDIAYARTAAVNLFVFGEGAFLFSCRSLRRQVWRVNLMDNVYLLWGVGLMALMQVIMTYWGPMNRLFQTTGLDATSWALILGISALILVVAEIDKWLTLHRLRIRWKPKRNGGNGNGNGNGDGDANVGAAA